MRLDTKEPDKCLHVVEEAPCRLKRLQVDLLCLDRLVLFEGPNILHHAAGAVTPAYSFVFETVIIIII